MWLSLLIRFVLVDLPGPRQMAIPAPGAGWGLRACSTDSTRRSGWRPSWRRPSRIIPDPTPKSDCYTACRRSQLFAPSGGSLPRWPAQAHWEPSKVLVVLSQGEVVFGRAAIQAHLTELSGPKGCLYLRAGPHRSLRGGGAEGFATLPSFLGNLPRCQLLLLGSGCGPIEITPPPSNGDVLLVLLRIGILRLPTTL